PYGDGSRAATSRLRRHLSLVSESDRAHVERVAGPTAFLDHLRRYLCNFLPHALPRHAWHATPLLQLRQLSIHSAVGAYAQYLYHHRRADRRHCTTGIRSKPDLEPVLRCARRRQSMARRIAGMANAADAA